MDFRRPTKRKRLMIAYSTAGSLAVAAAGLAVYLMSPTEQTYQPGGQVEGITRSLERAPSLASSAPAEENTSAAGETTPTKAGRKPGQYFTEVSAEAGINFTHFHGERSAQLPEDMGSGAAWGDYDSDGDDDLYVCNIAGPLTSSAADLSRSPAANRLYRNNGDGSFTDVTADSGTGFKGVSMGAAWADFDADGDLDLVVTNYGTNLLYRNDGGKFKDVSQSAGIAEAKGFWSGASWGDYDRDGDLDLYICGYVQYRFNLEDLNKTSLQYKATIPFTLNPSSYTPESNLLYRNNGNATFTEVGRQAGVDNPTGRSLSAAWCDFDADGWLDLYVANDISDNAMYRNLGNGKFEDISHKAWVADYRGAMGLAIGDWDNDTDFDIYITHWIAQENALYNNLLYVFGDSSQRAPSIRFMDIADQVGLGQISLDYVCWGTSFLDFDNDGRADLFVANGSTFQDENNPKRLVAMRNLLFQNRGEEEGFYELGSATSEVFTKPHVSRGAAFADYDKDGDTDIFVVNHGERAFLLRNDTGNRNHWLRVRLEGRAGNPQGLGACVFLRVGSQRQAQEIGSQSSYLSQNSSDALFGVGKATEIDEVLVKFLSGKTVRLAHVKANQTVLIPEDQT